MLNHLPELAVLQYWGMRVVLAGALGFAALYLALFPILLITARWKALRVMTAFLFVVPIFLVAIFATCLLFAWQVVLITKASRQSMPPQEAFRLELRERLHKEGLAAPGGEEDPYDYMLRHSPAFKESKYSESARWTVYATRKILSIYDIVMLLLLFGAFVTTVIPVSIDTLGYPFRKQNFFSMLWTVFRRLLAMLLYLGFAAAVFTLFALLFTWMTYSMTGLATRLIADVSLSARNASALVAYLHILGTTIFLLETTALVAMTMIAIGLAAGAGLKFWINHWLMRERRPRIGFSHAFAAFLRLVIKLAVASVATFLAVKAAGYLPGAAALPASIVLETLGFNFVLWRAKAFRDVNRLFSTTWELNTFGVKQAVKTEEL